MGWIVSLIVGGVVGWLASLIMKTDPQMGVLANIVVGIVGSMLGFWVAGLIGISAVGPLGRFVVSLAGAVLLIFILGRLGIFRKGS